MTASTINRLISLFDHAFKELAPGLDVSQSERMAMLVHQSMNPRTRSYHTTDHVFGMCKGANARQTLAALFHDLVYYQLDGGFPSGVAHLLQSAVRDDQGGITIRPFQTSDEVLALCTGVFGFEVGQPLSLYAGLNEFMSAVVAGRLLYKRISLADLVGVIACIEATIPFRNAEHNGQSAAQALAERVRAVTQKHVPALKGDALEAHIASVMKDSVEIGNRDVSGFAQESVGLFLSSTWLLIEESNAPLKSVGIYSLSEYRAALVRMADFLGHLDPDSIFQDYADSPGASTLHQWTEAAKRNLNFACDFLDCKTATVAIVEALALATGSDSPVSMFLGDISSANGRPERAEDHLPPAPTGKALNPELLEVFEKGRTLESHNDLTSSPLTAYAYRCIGHEGMRSAIADARRMFDGLISPLEFLHTLDRDMVRSIVRACAQIAFSRRDALLQLENAL